jgi:hypothetical protein
MADTADKVPNPVEGKFIFQIDPSIRIRFNADGWVEEVGKGGEEEPISTRLQGQAGTKFDDYYARRFYDLYSRAVIIDIHPKRISEQAVGAGLILFKDLEPGSHIYDRLTKIIDIANHHFKMNVKPLSP